MRKLETLKQNPGLYADYTHALSYLHNSGVLDILRELGRVQKVPEDSPNYIAAVAAQAEHSRGYNDAIDDIVYFRERYLDPVPVSAPPMDFGSINRAIQAGDLTEEEANELRRTGTAK